MESGTTRSGKQRSKSETQAKLLAKADPNYAYLWMKGVTVPEAEEEDRPDFYIIQKGPKLANLIRNLQSRVFYKHVELDSISPGNPSVKKWVLRVAEGYPNLNHDLFDDLLNTFREKLRSRSKEHGKFIVGALLTGKLLLLVHSRLDEALFKDKDSVRTAELVLHHKSVLRADLISFNGNGMHLSAYEHSKSWSLGHAEFWGISETDVGWDSLGNILLRVELDGFDYQIEIPCDLDVIEQMIDEGTLTKHGEIRFGVQNGKVIRVDANRIGMSFSKFIDTYVLLKEKIKNHEEFFNRIINPDAVFAHDADLVDTYQYEEDSKKVYEIGVSGSTIVRTKEHPRYLLCFFTGTYPRVKPRTSLVSMFYRSIFEGKARDVVHVGEPKSLEPTTLGELRVHNEVYCPEEAHQFIRENLRNMRDCKSRKTNLMLQSILCNFAKIHIKNEHIPEIFDFIDRDIILPSLRSEFADKSLFETEGIIEFKSKDKVDAKPSQFVTKTLVPMIRKYLKTGSLSRYCIIFGIEDDGTFIPLANMPSDRVTHIQETANKELASDNVELEIYPIQVGGGFLLLTLLIPILDS
ncbi:MAG: hypothetical protein ACXAB5_05815 [Candidatus Thorarchaeota archaeon]|jgi:hypothetical protein